MAKECPHRHYNFFLIAVLLRPGNEKNSRSCRRGTGRAKKCVVEHFVVVVERALYLYGTVKNSFEKFLLPLFWGFTRVGL